MTLSAEKQKILKDDKHNIKVVAGPGSGKTRVIVEKIHQLVLRGTPPNRILAITYTNKAADDLEKQLFEKMPKEHGFYVSTFHKFCTRFRSENPKYFTQTKGYRVLDEIGQYVFILRHKTEIQNGLDKPPNLKKLKDFFGRIKDNYSKDEVAKYTNPLIPAYNKYCDLLEADKKLDFGDLIQTVVTTIQSNKDLQKISQEMFDFMFIDEYQDVNRIQERLIKLFLGKKTKVMVVGDKNQSIFGFRGSDVTIFENFNKGFSNVEEYPLRKNYRSTTKIIKVSNRFMQLPDGKEVIGNYDPTDGPITEEGQKVRIRFYPSIEAESKAVADYLAELKKTRKIPNFSNVAILFRSVKSEFTKKLIEELETRGIRYEVIGDGGLLDLDYIDAIRDCIEQVHNSQEVKNDLLQINVKVAEFDEVKGCDALALFYKLIEKAPFFQNAMQKNQEDVMFNLGKLSKVIVWYSEGFPRRTDRLAEYLQHLPSALLDTEQPIEEYDDRVRLLTLHKAKGLQFPVVIIPNITNMGYKIRNDDPLQDMFPNYSAKQDLMNAFYVGITRAKQVLILSYSQPNTPDDPQEYIKKIMGNTDIIETESYEGGLKGWLKQKEEEVKLICKEPKNEMLELTYYKLVEYDLCNYAYKLRFHYDLQTPFTPELYTGTQLHLALYDMNMVMKTHNIFEWEKIIEKVPEKRKRLHYIHENILKTYLLKFQKELRNIESPEKTFEMVRANAIIRGKIDLLIKNPDKTYTIIEYKSGAYDRKTKDPIKDEKEKKERLSRAIKQVELYACALHPEYNVTKGIVYFLGGKGHRHDFKVNRKQMSLEIDVAISHILKQEFPINKSSCDSCVFCRYPICPYANKQAVPEFVLDEDYEDQDRET